jgi:thioredoxin reductase
LVINPGTPRNAGAAHRHDVPGLAGTSPGDRPASGRAASDRAASDRADLATGRADAVACGAAFVTGLAASAARLPGADGGFRVSLADGRAVRARRLLVASGMADELPDVPGVAERWGRDVLHCPYCQGWEVRGRDVGVLATGPTAARQALLWRQWSAGVALIRHTGPTPTPVEREQLAARDVALVCGAVTALEVADDRLTGVRLASGELIPCQAVVVQPRRTARADVLASLGLKPIEQQVDGHAVGSRVPADPTGAPAVPGVWVAGAVTGLHAPSIGATAAGARAAEALNADLIAEDVRLAVADHRRGRPFSADAEQEVCDRVLGDRRHGL